MSYMRQLRAEVSFCGPVLVVLLVVLVMGCSESGPADKAGGQVGARKWLSGRMSPVMANYSSAMRRRVPYEMQRWAPEILVASCIVFPGTGQVRAVFVGHSVAGDCELVVVLGRRTLGGVLEGDPWAPLDQEFEVRRVAVPLDLALRLGSSWSRDFDSMVESGPGVFDERPGMYLLDGHLYEFGVSLDSMGFVIGQLLDGCLDDPLVRAAERLIDGCGRPGVDVEDLLRGAILRE